LTDAVLAAERGYVAAALSRAPLPTHADPLVHAACAGAIASRYLAVGTPRSFAVIGDARAAELSLAAHRTWFAPRDLRATCDADGFRRVSLDEALAADIVCIHEPLAIAAGQLRRGTHVNALVAGVTLDASIAATISYEDPDLGKLAAGLVDGRQLDELTVFYLQPFA
jgi:hypothetical protein